MTTATDLPAVEPGGAPPPVVERLLGALVADGLLREAVLGDLAEGFATRCARDGPVQARRWYRREAARSAPALLAATWWPGRRRRARPIRECLAAGVGAVVLIQLLHQAAQQLAALALAAVGLTGHGWPFAACSLVAGAACGTLAGAAVAGRTREAPLADALALAAMCGALAVSGVLVNGGARPLWYWGGLQLVLLPASACAGALLRTARRPATPGA